MSVFYKLTDKGIMAIQQDTLNCSGCREFFSRYPASKSGAILEIAPADMGSKENVAAIRVCAARYIMHGWLVVATAAEVTLYTLQDRIVLWT